MRVSRRRFFLWILATVTLSPLAQARWARRTQQIYSGDSPIYATLLANVPGSDPVRANTSENFLFSQLVDAKRMAAYFARNRKLSPEERRAIGLHLFQAEPSTLLSFLENGAGAFLSEIHFQAAYDEWFDNNSHLHRRNLPRPPFGGKSLLDCLVPLLEASLSGV